MARRTPSGAVSPLLSPPADEGSVTWLAGEDLPSYDLVAWRRSAKLSHDLRNASADQPSTFRQANVPQSSSRYRKTQLAQMMSPGPPKQHGRDTKDKGEDKAVTEEQCDQQPAAVGQPNQQPAAPAADDQPEEQSAAPAADEQPEEQSAAEEEQTPKPSFLSSRLAGAQGRLRQRKEDVAAAAEQQHGGESQAADRSTEEQSAVAVTEEASDKQASGSDTEQLQELKQRHADEIKQLLEQKALETQQHADEMLEMLESMIEEALEEAEWEKVQIKEDLQKELAEAQTAIETLTQQVAASGDSQPLATPSAQAVKQANQEAAAKFKEWTQQKDAQVELNMRAQKEARTEWQEGLLSEHEQHEEQLRKQFGDKIVDLQARMQKVEEQLELAPFLAMSVMKGEVEEMQEKLLRLQEKLLQSSRKERGPLKLESEALDAQIKLKQELLAKHQAD